GNRAPLGPPGPDHPRNRTEAADPPDVPGPGLSGHQARPHPHRLLRTRRPPSRQMAAPRPEGDRAADGEPEAQAAPQARREEGGRENREEDRAIFQAEPGNEALPPALAGPAGETDRLKKDVET